MPKKVIVERSGVTHLVEMTEGVPEPGEGELVIKIVASGLCHTDLHMIDSDWPVKPTAHTPGHEGVGIVLRIGESVTGFVVDDRVGIPWLGFACGACDLCENGNEQYCQHAKNTGYSVDGAWADYMTVNAKFAVHIPASVSSIQAAPILCAGLTTYTALRKSNVKAGEWLLITGAAGGLGHLAVQYAKAAGVRVVAADIGTNKLEFVESLGADFALDPHALSGEQFLEQVRQKTGGGVHGVLALAPCVASVELAIQTLRRTGTAVIVALPPGEVKIPIFDLVTKGLTIVGSLVGTRADLKAALGFVARGEVQCNTHVEPMANYQEAVAKCRDGAFEGRVVFANAPDGVA